MSEIVSLREHGAPAKTPVVLVIDDEMAVRQSISIGLEEGGFNPVTARSGRQALAALRQTAPDLVLMDVALPEQDAGEAMRQIRRERPWIPVMAMSGSGGVAAGELFALAMKLGADAVIARPFDDDRLHAAIQDLLPRPAVREPLAHAS